ncbi:MAG TPA: porin [Candidatus Wunengus sp. YC63]|uniref:porin n=1 Tax=Candidatus Wunengus sp. YC63 TaxID=3367699 RepID=UPI004029233D
MHTKWKYILSSTMLFFSLYTNNILNSALAQETAQPKELPRSEMEDLKWQLKQMEESVQRQQEQIQALKNRLEAVSTETAPVIPKEEIQHVIEDYLETDEARKKMGLGLPGLTAVYTPDDEKYTLGVISPNGNYTLNVGGRMQFRYTFKDKDEDFKESGVQDFNLRRARVYFGGNVYTKFVHYYVELDADKFNIALRDFYIYVTFLEELNGKFGYFKVPFNRQFMASGFKLLLQDRSIASNAFSQNRDYGVDIYGHPFEGHMEYHAALFQGAGGNFTGLNNGDNIDNELGNFTGLNNGDNIDNELMYVLNLRYNPFGEYDYYDETDVSYTDKLKATIGASVSFNAKDNDKKLKNTDTIAGVVDLGVKYRDLSWNNEYFVRTEYPESDGDTVDSDGFYTQAGYFVIPKKLELAARYSVLDPNNNVSDDLQREYTGGINYYFRAHRSKIQGDVGHYVTNTKTEDKEENRFRIQYQIIF